MASKESLNNLSADDLAMTLNERLCNQRVAIFKIAAILMWINGDAVNGKSKPHVKKTIGKIYEDAMEDVDKSKQHKKTYLIGTINKVATIMLKPDNKELNTPNQVRKKKIHILMKESRKI